MAMHWIKGAAVIIYNCYLLFTFYETIPIKYSVKLYI